MINIIMNTHSLCERALAGNPKKKYIEANFVEALGFELLEFKGSSDQLFERILTLAKDNFITHNETPVEIYGDIEKLADKIHLLSQEELKKLPEELGNLANRITSDSTFSNHSTNNSMPNSFYSDHSLSSSSLSNVNLSILDLELEPNNESFDEEIQEDRRFLASMIHLIKAQLYAHPDVAQQCLECLLQTIRDDEDSFALVEKLKKIIDTIPVDEKPYQELIEMHIQAHHCLTDLKLQFKTIDELIEFKDNFKNQMVKNEWEEGLKTSVCSIVSLLEQRTERLTINAVNLPSPPHCKESKSDHSSQTCNKRKIDDELELLLLQNNKIQKTSHELASLNHSIFDYFKDNDLVSLEKIFKQKKEECSKEQFNQFIYQNDANGNNLLELAIRAKNIEVILLLYCYNFNLDPLWNQGNDFLYYCVQSINDKLESKSNDEKFITMSNLLLSSGIFPDSKTRSSIFYCLPKLLMNLDMTTFYANQTEHLLRTIIRSGILMGSEVEWSRSEVEWSLRFDKHDTKCTKHFMQLLSSTSYPLIVGCKINNLEAYFFEEDNVQSYIYNTKSLKRIITNLESTSDQAFDFSVNTFYILIANLITNPNSLNNRDVANFYPEALKMLYQNFSTKLESISPQLLIIANQILKSSEKLEQAEEYINIGLSLAELNQWYKNIRTEQNRT